MPKPEYLDMMSVLRDLQSIYTVASVSILSRLNFGKDIFDEEWDLMIVLDACRVDALEIVAKEYDFLENKEIDSVWSQGSTSKEWINNIFSEKNKEELRRTAYVSANGFSHDLRAEGREYQFVEFEDSLIHEDGKIADFLLKGDLASEDYLGLLDGLWGDPDASQDEANQRMPSNITDHTIWIGRNEDYERIIAHYMQPHAPYYASSTEYTELLDYEKNPFGELKAGAEHTDVWEAYLDNLRLVLDSVELLLKNIDCETVIITADHGELFGEIGLYSHHAGIPHPKLKKVPWVKVTGKDIKTHEPDVGREEVIERTSGRISDESLEALGYL